MRGVQRSCGHPRFLLVHDAEHQPAHGTFLVPDRIARRYHANEVLPKLFRRERPGGRLLVLGDQPQTDQPIVLSEFGGIACPARPGTWGRETVVGEGAVNWRGIFDVISSDLPQVNLVIEREARQERLDDIRAAHRLIMEHLARPSETVHG